MLTPSDQYAMLLTMIRGMNVVRLTGQELRQLQGPYVYELVRPADPSGVLYVGVKSSQGERPFDPGHHAVGRGSEVRPDDELYIYPMPNPSVAQWAEKAILANTPTERNRQRFHVNAWSQFSPFEPLPSADEWKNEREGLETALL